MKKMNHVKLFQALCKAKIEMSAFYQSRNVLFWVRESEGAGGNGRSP